MLFFFLMAKHLSLSFTIKPEIRRNLAFNKKKEKLLSTALWACLNRASNHQMHNQAIQF